jgi:ADP-L-glycero-D-manno-heptose 6-epimerase
MKSVVNKGFEQIRETGELTLFKSHREDYADGEQKRDFIYVKDCVTLIAELLKSKAIHGLFNLGTGDARSFKDLGLAIFEAMELEPNIRYVDMPEHLQDRYQYYTEAKMDRLADISHKLHLTSLEEGVSDYVKTYLLTGDRL